MPIRSLDHFTVLTQDTDRTITFYRTLLGLEPGPRPAFDFPGAWLYSGDKPVLHVVEKRVVPKGAGVLDHMAFRGDNLSSFLGKLISQGMKYDLRRLPEPGHAGGTWQLFFNDPNGARVEIDFDKSEIAEL